MARIGVLAVQGAFARHADMLQTLRHQPILVRTASDLAELAGLVLPGGESTVQLSLIERLALAEPLQALVRQGVPVLATCAGMILAAREVQNPAQKSFAWIDVSVTRNGFGRQVDSFEARADDGRLPLVFIRAPRIREVGPGVEVLARYRDEPVLVRQGLVTAASFHPELSGDDSVHAQVFGRG
jgi:pyridoxal 5'-phosphate synthase pdxT subunit